MDAGCGKLMWRAELVPRLKRTALIWLAVYPTVLTVVSVLGPYVGQWPLPLRVLGSTLVIVPIVVNISAPLVETLVSAVRRYWLRYKQRSTSPE
jgi:antibiotic biosynthesis monooxygenase (ABM) superfamily enzyme